MSRRHCDGCGTQIINHGWVSLDGRRLLCGQSRVRINGTWVERPECSIVPRLKTTRSPLRSVNDRDGGSTAVKTSARLAA